MPQKPKFEGHLKDDKGVLWPYTERTITRADGAVGITRRAWHCHPTKGWQSFDGSHMTIVSKEDNDAESLD